jgi:hypothetical protein
MHNYPELDLSFLHDDLSSLPREVYQQPEQYIETKKVAFAQALVNYNQITATPLLIELDIPTFLSSRSLEQKIAQLFVF